MHRSKQQNFVEKYWFYGLSILVLIIIVILGVLSLRDGFTGDQALFLIYSKAINNGAVLYRDIWDIKQPGIFVFYLIGGKLFGFNEVGIHLFELIYWLGLSLIMIFGLKSYFKNSLFAILTPLFTIGVYYSVSGGLHWTQAEALVCFPLFMSLWFCRKFLEKPEKKNFLILSGLFGGIVLLFKLLFVLILAAFWLLLFLYCKKNIKKVLIMSGFILIGLLIPAAITIFYFAVNNALDDLWYVTIVYPSSALLEVTMMENRTLQLKEGLIWWLKSYFPVILLTALFIVLNLRSYFNNWRQNKTLKIERENFLFLGLFIWTFIGFGVILIQRLSWWEYHYSLLMLPLGILAVKCIEILFELIKNNQTFKHKTLVYILSAILITPLFIPTARRLADRIKQFNNVETAKAGNRELKVTGAAVGDYKSISKDTAFLTKETPKAPIFIFSNPLYYYISDTPPPYSSNGAMADMFTDYEWKKFNREMSEKPAKYIFIEPVFLKIMKAANPAFVETLNKNYSVYSTGDRGVFYKLNE